MQIALAQINCTVGDLAGNAAKIVDCAQRAKGLGATLMLTPELALTGYPPEDLLLREGFYHSCDRALAGLARQTHGISILVGHPHRVRGKRFNAASLLRDGEIVTTYHKQRLPNDTVFDEERYFDPGSGACIIEIEGNRFAVNICEDVWGEDAVRLAHDAGADALLVLNASPYHIDKQMTRYEVLRDRIGETGLPVLYMNLVGGQDELVFDGASFAMNRRGELVRQLAQFEETLGIVTMEDKDFPPGEIVPELPQEAAVYRALCLGVRDYIGKNGFPGVLLGLSGGVDSALTLAIAVDALGAEKVHAVMMPSQFTAKMSLEDARQMVEGLGVRYSEILIKPVFDAFMNALAVEFDGLPFDTTEENLQARIRGTLLMGLSNKYGSIVLTTGNKSEMAVGYSTLYGDMAGGFAVIKDISKTLVYRLSRYRNEIGPVIPDRVLTRAPTAELRANQADQDSLPPYDILDGIMAAYMERDQSPNEIIALGYPPDDVRRVVQLIKRNEYKRRQSPIGVRITKRGFGKDWRYPITSKYEAEF
jgi:NAD+ synthase (glutamine-hydrolysing)